MENFYHEYIYLDGAWLKEEQLLKLAQFAGSFVVAEHYLCAYLANALMNGYKDALKKVNAIREAYGVAPIPVSDKEEKHDRPKSNNTKLDEQARMAYLMSDDEERGDIIKACLQKIIVNHRKLFKSRISWNAIFLVVRDRVDGRLTRAGFDNLSNKFIPDGWPEELSFGVAALGNYSHYIDASDRYEAYYDMENNPWAELCDTFWELLKQEIFTKKLRIIR